MASKQVTLDFKIEDEGGALWISFRDNEQDSDNLIIPFFVENAVKNHT